MRELEPGFWHFDTREEAEAFYASRGSPEGWALMAIDILEEIGATIQSKDGSDIIKGGYILTDNKP